MKSDNHDNAPKLANWLLSKAVPSQLHEEFLGDLKEAYENRITSRGKAYASFMYWVDVIHLLTGFSSFQLFSTENSTVMTQHYLHTFLRNFVRNKAYSFVNIFSLVIGMGTCLAICQYIYFELSYDRFHKNRENIYRVVIDEIKGEGDMYPYPYETGYAVGIAAKDEIPDVKQYIRLHKYSGGAVVASDDGTRIFNEDGFNLLFVDKAFLDVFNFPLKLGNKNAALDDKYGIVITDKTAKRYFGTNDPIGGTLIVSGGISPGNYTVTGVLEDLPLNSHLQFDFLLPIENYMEYGWGGAAIKNDDGWTSPDCSTYLVIEQSANLNVIEEKLTNLVAKKMVNKNTHKNTTYQAALQPLQDIHLKSDLTVDQALVRNNGNFGNIQFFSIIAFFIVMIAWANYINLSTARSMHRAKEVGIRKSIGALKIQLIGQFITESLLVNLIAGILAIGLASLLLPVLADIIGTQIDFGLLGLPVFWFWFLVVITGGALLSGLFPAVVLSSLKPISMLGARKVTKIGDLNLRKGLITLQFVISLLLISGTYLVYKQINFMKNQEMGMEVEKILVLRGPEVSLNESSLESNLRSFTQKVSNHHSIAAVAASSSVPGKGYNTGIVVRKLGAPATADRFARVIFAGFGLPTAYDLEFIAGQSPDLNTISGEERVVVINEEAVHAFQLGSPENALHEKLFYKNDTFAIAGVVKNFHWHSLADAQTPYLFEFYNDCKMYFSFRLNLSNIQESLTHIEATYNNFFPGNAFDYFFLEEEFNQQYKSDIQFGNLFFAFTILAIFIACIGLFALVSYSATLKIREVGIRKVMGASTGNLMLLLSREYLVLLIIASLIAIPAILYCGKAWLDNYATRMSIGVDLFVIPVIILVLIAALTVCQKTFATARANPVDSLRKE